MEKKNLYKGHIWVLGAGTEIYMVKDPWLNGKEDFCVNQDHDYRVNNIMVSNFFMEGSGS